ncbi:hypothetical protein PviCFBP13515_21360 [Pseudomonas viridiflava]|nr:hypothetical protein PviCFBP13507_21885 [Pseudomonas viridiflava]TKK22150.1 hypothetical protein PviCFBP13515_21360 [Pseudomonas viridiflava]
MSRQAASYQTACKPLKKRDFVGADRAAFRLSAKGPVHPTHMQWLKYCIRGQVRSHEVCCATALHRRRGEASHSPAFGARQRYVEVGWRVPHQMQQIVHFFSGRLGICPIRA